MTAKPSTVRGRGVSIVALI